MLREGSGEGNIERNRGARERGEREMRGQEVLRGEGIEEERRGEKRKKKCGDTTRRKSERRRRRGK